ncbi:MAG TPA: tetratricopeptide repeat protein [Thermoanaerobaculia bacterium]
MKLMILWLILAFTVQAAPAADEAACRRLLATEFTTKDKTGAFQRDAAQAFRQCVGEQFPVATRVQAHLQYGRALEIDERKDEALRVYLDAIRLLEGDAGGGSRLLIDALDRAAALESRTGRGSAAVAHSERALALRRETYGAASEEAAQGLIRLALVHIEQRAFPAAEPLIREAIDTARKACGEECGTLAEALVAMSTWYGDQGDEVSARHWFELSVEAQPPARRSRRQ